MHRRVTTLPDWHYDRRGLCAQVLERKFRRRVPLQIDAIRRVVPNCVIKTSNPGNAGRLIRAGETNFVSHRGRSAAIHLHERSEDLPIGRGDAGYLIVARSHEKIHQHDEPDRQSRQRTDYNRNKSAYRRNIHFANASLYYSSHQATVAADIRLPRNGRSQMTAVGRDASLDAGAVAAGGRRPF
jgi:hypothetical protein